MPVRKNSFLNNFFPLMVTAWIINTQCVLRKRNEAEQHNFETSSPSAHYTHFIAAFKIYFSSSEKVSKIALVAIELHRE